MKTMRSGLISALALLILSQSAHAIKAIEVDKDSDGVIQAKEYRSFAITSNSPSLGKFDLNGDGELGPTELLEANKALKEANEKSNLLLAEFEIDYPEGQPIAEFAKVNSTEDAAKFASVPSLKPNRLMVRKSYEDVRIGTAPKKPSLAGPAEIQLTNDKKNDNEILVLRGTVLRPYGVGKDGNTLIVPSVTLNRVTNDKESAKEVNSLILRIGGDWEFDPSWSDLAYFRLSPAWTTDTRFDLDIRGVDVQLEPVWLPLGQHVARAIGPLSVKWRAFLQAEYGDVHDSDDRQDLVEGEKFARLGASTQWTIWPDQVERLSFNMGYAYLWKISGDLRDRKLFNGSIDWQIDESGHYKLQLKYLNGDSSVALEDEETWSIGVGILY